MNKKEESYGVLKKERRVVISDREWWESSELTVIQQQKNNKKPFQSESVTAGYRKKGPKVSSFFVPHLHSTTQNIENGI